MIFGIFILLVAISISGIAAYYSIAGLTTIFAAAAVPIIIMGVALELGKITATVFLHKFWHRVDIKFKIYLVPAIAILMLITSMGIFGFLSKAHLDQTAPAGDKFAEVQILDDKIKTARDNIDSNKRALAQMDAQVDQLLSRTTDDKGANRAVQIRRTQAKERKIIQAEIAQEQKIIIALQAERAPIAVEARKIEAEVGPIKYVAALIYGDNPDSNLLERAVRWIIILLVLVFDPLALILILAGEQVLIWTNEDKRKKNEESPEIIEPPEELDIVQVDEPTADNEVQVDEPISNAESKIELELEPIEDKIEPDNSIGHSYLDTPWVHIPVEPYKEPLLVEPEKKIELPLETPVLQNTELSHWNPTPKDLNAFPHTVDTSVNFGDKLPDTPALKMGDLFLLIDKIPSRLYKWNSQKWIEVDKESTDQYAFNEAYIKHLAEKLQSGEYDVDLLTQAEQEQIMQYLSRIQNANK